MEGDRCADEVRRLAEKKHYWYRGQGDAARGKFKMSQELKEGDREGVIKGLQEMESSEIAETVRWRTDLKK